jgi:hypothetical protein
MVSMEDRGILDAEAGTFNEELLGDDEYVRG